MGKCLLVSLSLSLTLILCPLTTSSQTINMLSVQQENSDKNYLNRIIEELRFDKELTTSLIEYSKTAKEPKAGSFVVMRLNDGKILWQKNQNVRYPIASLTKLMTTVVALENLNMDGRIVLEDKILTPLGDSPSLFSGLNISLKNLIAASLIQSSNDAAEAITYFLGKSKFLSLMNKKAKELNMTNTVFYDAHGLSPKNISTANDLIKLILYIYQKHPDILSLTKENNFWLPDREGNLLKFRNMNLFYPMPNFIGGKTGYLKQAKNTFVGIFKRHGENLAIVVLYSNNLKSDVLSLLKE